MWFIIGPITLLVLYFGIKMYKNSSPQGFPRELAKAQLKSFYIVRLKNPNAQPRELYQLALQSRPGYSLDDVAEIIDGAETSSEIAEVPFCFSQVVCQMAAYKYMVRTNLAVGPVIQDITSGVYSVIPDDL